MRAGKRETRTIVDDCLHISYHYTRHCVNNLLLPENLNRAWLPKQGLALFPNWADANRIPSSD